MRKYTIDKRYCVFHIPGFVNSKGARQKASRDAAISANEKNDVAKVYRNSIITEEIIKIWTRSYPSNGLMQIYSGLKITSSVFCHNSVDVNLQCKWSWVMSFMEDRTKPRGQGTI